MKSINWLITLNFLLITGTTEAQVIPDATFSTQVDSKANITGGQTIRDNLFHSFEQFSPVSGTTTTFQHFPAIKNIFTRVTGASPSLINGIIATFDGTSKGQANLFLINPNGIIFGSGAALNIGGSFISSTAQGILFDDGSIFSAKPTAPSSLLNVRVPLGLVFPETARAITVEANPQNSLAVLPEKTLALVGGTIDITNRRLQAPQGQVQIGSVGQGIVKITETLGAWRFDYSQVSSWQDIKLSQNAVIITVSRSPLDTLTPSFIELSGRRISLDKSAIESSNLLSKQPASNIYLRAVESLYLNNLSSIDSRTFAEGDAGKIFVETPQLELDNFSSLSASAEEGSLGNGGEILIGASNFVKLSNGSAINVLTGASGNGGTIVIDSPQLSINTGAKIVAQTFAEGQGGNIKINVLDLDINGVSKNRVERSRIFVNSSFGEVELDVGDAGTIEITAKTLRVREGGLISARTETQGNGGNLVLNVSDSIEVTGTGEVFVFVQPTVRKLQIVPSTISSSSSGAGEAGNLQIKTGNLRILAGGIIEAGAISTGQAGDIFINTRTIELDRGEILTDNANLDGGNITLKASEFLTLRQGSTISTNAGADGGNISIVTPFILGVSQENSDITANADAGGRGGNININTQGIFGLEPREKPTNLSDITASSAFGTAGIVNINNSAIEAQEVTQELPNEPLDAALIIDQALCSVGRTNELTVSGRGGLPSNPEQLISGNQPWEDWRPGEETSQEPTPHTTVKETPRQLPLREFQGWAVNARGQIVLTAQANMVTPQGDWLPPFGCQNLR